MCKLDDIIYHFNNQTSLSIYINYTHKKKKKERQLFIMFIIWGLQTHHNLHIRNSDIYIVKFYEI